MEYTRPRGTNDILPEEAYRWLELEKLLRFVAGLYGYREIRTPVFEHTELFLRSVGETTDIVEKEMYTFEDRGKRSLTLRPEGTAPAVRAFVENKLYAGTLPEKLYYIGPMFRYDRPQAGRYRQFHQFGIEVFGSKDPRIDAEVIAMAMDIYGRLGLQDLSVELNSVGCPRCRPVHRAALQEYLAGKKDELCSTCQGRFAKNPLRILDCKNDECHKLIADAPTIAEMLCPECLEHFGKVQEYLKALGVAYNLNPCLVRGLDYYTQTAFEIVAQGIGAQSSIGGGGRYDGLIQQIGGPPLPGIGFALGLERILLTLKEQGIALGSPANVEVFVASMGEMAQIRGAVLAQELRGVGLVTEQDYQNRSLKAQLKAADRLKAAFTVIIGEEELRNDQAVVKDMINGNQLVVDLADAGRYLLQELKGGAINNE